MEILSYDCKETIVEDNRIAICGRWSIFSMYSSYLREWKEYKELIQLMEKHKIDKLFIYYSDMETGLEFMDFGKIELFQFNYQIEIESECIDLNKNQKSSLWNVCEFLLYDDDSNPLHLKIDDDLLHELIEQNRDTLFHS